MGAKTMKIGIVISTNDPEVVWNAFRFGNVSLQENHEVKIFLMNKGVEIEEIKSERFNVKEQMDSFIKKNGQMIACETCLLVTRQKEGFNLCPLATLKDLLRLVGEVDKILTFG
jgi:uncharacterized protein involved in oxidation of intracellular sulfur